MTRTAITYCLLFVSVTLAIGGCSSKRVAVAPPPAPPAPIITAPHLTVILLPEENGKQGHVSVTNNSGTQDLAQANHAIQVRSGAAPPAPVPVPKGEWKAKYGAMLAALPDPALTFHLHFVENSVNLNAESTRMLPDILRAIGDRKSTDISVTGHTDTTGTSEANAKLARERADAIAKIFVERGINSDYLFVTSHGEANLLVRTADNVREERNRRVEVIVR